MCRMIFAVGKIDTGHLFDGFMAMAKGVNEHHELNRESQLNHPDGWGIAYLDEGSIKKYKKELPVWEDESFERFRNIKTNTLVLHARRSSSTPCTYENTQPFYRKLPKTEYIFCHNGSVYERLPYSSIFYPLGETDSEMLFYYLLSSTRDNGSSIESAICRIKDFTAANIILMNNRRAIIIQRYCKDPLYYTMKIFADEEQIIISSEKLKGYVSDRWIPIENNSLVRVDINNAEYTIAKLN